MEVDLYLRLWQVLHGFRVEVVEADSACIGERGYARSMAERTLLQRIHNPSNYECGCDPDCWCRRTALGRAVKWWFPARLFRIRHKNSFFDAMTWAEIREWKREQERKGLYP
jgi:hypothetical protein